MIRYENLDFWVKNNFNVLFIGHAGVGKTSIVKSAFERHNLNWRYFSASTMDPWVDLVGIPKEHTDEKGESYLDLIRPQGLDQVEAIFFDEFNRSHKKVRNACMELLQFKTINGRAFPNLKIVWAAINPDGEDGYDVERLDPAQKDRFHIYVDVPYKPDSRYFASKYGNEMANSAISWWSELPEELKMEVSPRRLDYALDVLNKNGDINYVLPQKSNISKLLVTLEYGPVSLKLEEVFQKRDPEEARNFLSSENVYQYCIEDIKKSPAKKEFFLPLLSAERLAVLATEMSILKFMIQRCSSSEVFTQVLTNILVANQNHKAVNEIKKHTTKDKNIFKLLSFNKWMTGNNPQPPYYALDKNDEYGPHIERMLKSPFKTSSTTSSRAKIYNYIYSEIPSTLSTQTALQTLQILDIIAFRSHYTSLAVKPKLMGIFNHCIHQIHLNEKLGTYPILQKYSTNKFPYLWKFISAHKDYSAGLEIYNVSEVA